MSSVAVEQQKRSEHIGLFLEPRLRAELERAARENERSISAEVRLALRRHLAASDGGRR